METWIQRLFLIASLASTCSLALAEERISVLDKVIAPDLERRQIKADDLDSENFEIGFYSGVMSVEDFGTNSVSGVRLAYHISEDFFAEMAYGLTTTSQTSFERLSGSTPILSEDQRELSYYNLSLGYNLFPGEIFFTDKWVFNSNWYLITGVGNTSFADEEHFTYNIGTGIRLYATDWLSLNAGMRAHLFSHEILGEEQNVINLEATLGASVFF